MLECQLTISIGNDYTRSMHHCLALVRLTHCLSVHCLAELNGYRSVSVSMLSLTASAVRRAVKGQSMGKRDNKVLSLVGVDLADADNSQLKDYFASTLKRGMHGIGFSAVSYTHLTLPTTPYV